MSGATVRLHTGAECRGRYSKRTLFLSSPSPSQDYASTPSLPPPSLSSCTIPLPRVVTRDQTGADLFTLSPVSCLTASAMEKFPFSLCLSRCTAVAVLLRQGKQGDENKRANILPNTLSHSVYSHFRTPQVASHQLCLP